MCRYKTKQKKQQKPKIKTPAASLEHICVLIAENSQSLSEAISQHWGGCFLLG